MKKTLLAITSALLLTGAMSSTASAQDGYYDNDDRDDGRYAQAYGDRHDDRYDDRQDERDGGYVDRNGRYVERNDGYDDRVRANRYGNEDRDRDGVHDRYDRWDNLRRVSWDVDRNGVNDRYQGNRRVGDRDRDGVPNRYDRYDDRRYQATQRYNGGRYVQPRNYRYTRYDIGSRLPPGYYGSNYYVDYRPYGLSAPPSGYRWNRVGSDAYLVSVTNGVVRDVIYSLFY
jgi:Ni/Co efflux regulator RcnB